MHCFLEDEQRELIESLDRLSSVSLSSLIGRLSLMRPIIHPGNIPDVRSHVGQLF